MQLKAILQFWLEKMYIEVNSPDISQKYSQKTKCKIYSKTYNPI